MLCGPFNRHTRYYFSPPTLPLRLRYPTISEKHKHTSVIRYSVKGDGAVGQLRVNGNEASCMAVSDLSKRQGEQNIGNEENCG